MCSLLKILEGYTDKFKSVGIDYCFSFYDKEYLNKDFYYNGPDYYTGTCKGSEVREKSESLLLQIFLHNKNRDSLRIFVNSKYFFSDIVIVIGEIETGTVLSKSCFFLSRNIKNLLDKIMQSPLISDTFQYVEDVVKLGIFSYTENFSEAIYSFYSAKHIDTFPICSGESNFLTESSDVFYILNEFTDIFSSNFSSFPTDCFRDLYGIFEKSIVNKLNYNTNGRYYGFSRFYFNFSCSKFDNIVYLEVYGTLRRNILDIEFAFNNYDDYVVKISVDLFKKDDVKYIKRTIITILKYFENNLQDSFSISRASSSFANFMIKKFSSYLEERKIFHYSNRLED